MAKVAQYGVLTALVFCSASTAPAQEIDWQEDFARACQLARARNRPVVVEFGTEQCFWCRKLEATTLRDPGIVELLRRQFVAVRLDGARSSALAETWQIHSYPSLVFLSAEGKLLGVHAGYVDAARFRSQLEHALAESASRGSSPAPRAQVRTTVHPQPAEVDGVAAAREMLAQARNDLQQGNEHACLARCRALRQQYPETVEANEARALCERAVGVASERLGLLYLELAEERLRCGQGQEARNLLQRVVDVCPDAQPARTARTRLTGLSGLRRKSAPRRRDTWLRPRMTLIPVLDSPRFMLYGVAEWLVFGRVEHAAPA